MGLKIIQGDLSLSLVDVHVTSAHSDLQCPENTKYYMPVERSKDITNPAAYNSGINAHIHTIAGERLATACKQLSPIEAGDVAITDSFNLFSKYLYHAVGPVWEGGDNNEEALLAECYWKCITAAISQEHTSIALPLISSGKKGFPKPLALKIAAETIRTCLRNEDDPLNVYLFVHNKEDFDKIDPTWKAAMESPITQ